jgi:hypothetical protein
MSNEEIAQAKIMLILKYGSLDAAERAYNMRSADYSFSTAESNAVWDHALNA